MIIGQLGASSVPLAVLKNSILTFAQEKNPEPLEKMVERALGALRFSKNATLKISPFEAHHGREANTVLRNLTKKTISSKSGLVTGYNNEKCLFRCRQSQCAEYAPSSRYKLESTIGLGI